MYFLLRPLETAIRRELFTWAGIVNVLTVVVFSVLVFVGSGADRLIDLLTRLALAVRGIEVSPVARTDDKWFLIALMVYAIVCMVVTGLLEAKGIVKGRR